jgi:hypothetical protein
VIIPCINLYNTESMLSKSQIKIGIQLLRLKERPSPKKILKHRSGSRDICESFEFLISLLVHSGVHIKAINEK